jgi:hypothetical protein
MMILFCFFIVKGFDVSAFHNEKTEKKRLSADMGKIMTSKNSRSDREFLLGVIF